jgi:hypothetical protein
MTAGRKIKIKMVPYEKIKSEGLKNLISILEEGSIILTDAKLTAKEEADLIEETMKNVSEKFVGIEMSSIDLSRSKANGIEKFRGALAERITGKKRGVTIIGPAKIIRKIEKNPEELLLYM